MGLILLSLYAHSAVYGNALRKWVRGAQAVYQTVVTPRFPCGTRAVTVMISLTQLHSSPDLPDTTPPQSRLGLPNTAPQWSQF